MELTKKWLNEQGACDEAVKAFCNQRERDSLKILKLLIKSKEEEKLDWANWLIVRLMTYRQYVSYAVFAAEQVIGKYEKKYPDDKRPREAIEAAKKCINNPSKENKNAAAAYAACTAYAAYAAYAAAYAACTAYAAAAAADAAYAAAAYAAAATKQKIKIRILNHGIKILEGKE